MSIRADSYSSISDVTAYTRHLLDGYASFNEVTRPTHAEVERFIDRASGILNMAFWQHGYNPANITANSTAKLWADDWVTNRAAAYVEMTQRGAGYGDGENGRLAMFLTGLSASANQEVMAIQASFDRMGIDRTISAHTGLAFTGLTVYADRADPDNTSLEQPKFRRGQFENP